MTLTFKSVQRDAAPLPVTWRRFANPDVVCEGWYTVGPAGRIRRGDIVQVSIGRRDLVVYRGLDGLLHALDRHCAHLGADLTKGAVVEKGLQCGFHNWCWGADGACVAGAGVAASARMASYAVRERWGLVWVWAGGTPAYDLPMPEPENRVHTLRLPEQQLACASQVVLGNGLDLTHVVPIHRFRFLDDPVVAQDGPHRLSVTVHTRFDPTPMRRLLGVVDQPARWQFTVVGPSLAWVKVMAPTSFELVWAARPLADGRCAVRTIFFLPRVRAMTRALPMMIATTWADRRILDQLRFQPGFVPSDAVFAQYARLVEALPEW